MAAFVEAADIVPMDAAADRGPDPPAEWSKAVAAGSRELKVLIFDDATVVRDRIVAALAEVPGVDVMTEAPSSADPYARVLLIRPDVVIVDVCMPHARAIELIRKIKAAGHCPLVIALSSQTSLQYRVTCHDAGAAYFFDKALELDRLVEAIRALCSEIG